MIQINYTVRVGVWEVAENIPVSFSQNNNKDEMSSKSEVVSFIHTSFTWVCAETSVNYVLLCQDIV